ncbi:MAG: cardiolipin synthase [Akkermansiaceae bacterium]
MTLAWNFGVIQCLGLVLVIFFILGVMHSLHVLKHVRSSQGAIAWIGGLLMLPIVVVPLYWLTGRTRYHNYVKARKSLHDELSDVYDELKEASYRYGYQSENELINAVSKIRYVHSTAGNEMQLLKDAHEKFEKVFEELKNAKEYILVEYFTIKSDRIGTRFKDALLEQVNKGVRVYVLYDSFGSSDMSDDYIDELKQAGVHIHSFGIKRKWLSRFQLNFRNHRKIIVIDGEQAFIGGINIGDEYLGRDEEIGYWRDTHMHVRGPAVWGLQTVVLEDYYWGTGELIDVRWDQDFSDLSETSEKATSLASSPSDDFDTWHLTLAAAASVAKERLWITTPYLVPDEGLITALQTAVMRGVDVRILFPKESDQIIVAYAAYTFEEDLIPMGIKLHAYHKGFTHQKVVLVDSNTAMVGTANLDNRSFRLNFEIMMLTESEKMIQKVEEMLNDDFANSMRIEESELADKNVFVRIFSNFARLFVPIL